MKKINYKSRKGFTLIELLVVIGILAVLAAIAIPSVAGLIDRANVSADKTNSAEMTNAMERFTSEYELFCQDIASGTFDKNNMDAAQSRVYSVLGIEDRAGIEVVEIDADETVEDDVVAIYRDTKYPANAYTAQLIVQNYTKTSSSTFEPKQSDMHYWYSPDCGIIITAPIDSTRDELNDLIVSQTDAKGNPLGEQTQWINLTTNEILLKGLSKLTPITWNNLTNFNGSNVWTDGINMYWSYKYDHYILRGNTWETITFEGLETLYGQKFEFYGAGVWTNGYRIYHSYNYNTVYLENGKWKSYTINGSGPIYGQHVWNYNGKMYYTYNKTTAWINGNNRVYQNYPDNLFVTEGAYVWHYEGKTYYSYNNNQYIFNGSTWSKHTWDGLTNFYGNCVWSDGVNTYYSKGTDHYVLQGDTWVRKTWNGLDSFNGYNIWTDGTKYYYSESGMNYVFS